MGWNVTSFEGKKCYERCDGIRVFDTDSITAIEQHEKAQMQKLRESLQHLPYKEQDYYEQEISEPMTKAEMIIVSIIIIGLIIAFITGSPQ